MATSLPLPAIKPLDVGSDGYLRWKETLLLHLHSIGVGHVLFEDPPPSGGSSLSFSAAATARQRWARMDAVCRGHILAALSDRLLLDYAHHGTARAVWEAVARTYDLTAAAPCVSFRRFQRFKFDDGAPVLEQLAHLQALAADFAEPDDSTVAKVVHARLPENARFPTAEDEGSIMTMDKVWDEARFKEEARLARIEAEISEAMLAAQDPKGHLQCWKCWRRGHLWKNCTMPDRR
jgi:hypothetical protein